MDRKQAKLDYKLGHRQMGVFQIRNLINDKIFIASSIDVPGFINRSTFQLNAGSHPSLALQREWVEFGEENFAFEVLEELEPLDDQHHDYKSDVLFLEEAWLGKEQPYGDAGYNQKKLTREERLQKIAANRTK